MRVMSPPLLASRHWIYFSLKCLNEWKADLSAWPPLR
jgi:hypothetical protein